ncbi:YibE/F family protein [Trueperella bialowiezensis]|uniref:YibE/F-like protein n=1 Tax=Trueperella bialowiezensis TaxID=312285 RepID=A0A448PCA8_9ACTO|nr:YibE/F family protein [Trueperella bialowiezensis]VEI12583.1 YibE/F-like protein [Trueperella bialowiezensis]
MGAHGSGRLNLAPKDRRRVQLILAAIVVPLAVATIAGLIALWPRGSTPVGSVQLLDSGVEMATGKITSIGQTDELGQTPVHMEVSGVEVPVHVPFDVVGNGLSEGDTIKAMFNPAALDTGTPYIFVDFVRGVPLIALLALYVIVVLAVARIKGLAALLGLGASLAVVGAFMLPALMVGEDPRLVVMVGASAMMFSSIYLAHGVSIRTTTAVLGTFAGLVITGLLAVWAVGATKLTGTLSDDARTLYGELGYLDMRHILLTGIVLAGLGALNDVTITQVSTVWELHSANPQASRRRIFRQGMVIGRDHIASTVYTLAFAYVGTSLPLLMSAALVDRGFLDLMTVGQIAEEVVRTLVASIGLVLAIPMTTLIATWLAPVAPAKQVSDE